MAMTADGYSTYMYDLIKKVMDDIGPRESCSEQERELGRLFGSEIAPVCEKVVTDDFTCSPTAFLGFFPYLVLMYLAGVVLYFFLPAVSVALALLGGGILFFEVVRYKELLDPLFPKRSGQNVSGYVKPRGESEKRVYVSAHLDSAYEFKLWYWFKGLSAPVMGIGAVGLLFLLGCSIARTSVNAVGLPHGVYWVLGWILVGLAKYFGDAMSSGDFYPQKTEVVLVGMSSEEAGLRGAKRYAARLREEPDSLPLSSIFLDGIYDERYLTIFTKEIWPGAKLDQGPGGRGPRSRCGRWI
jgi:hypothetical protein